MTECVVILHLVFKRLLIFQQNYSNSKLMLDAIILSLHYIISVNTKRLLMSVTQKQSVKFTLSNKNQCNVYSGITGTTI
jgi:hypothetical protein